jgi:hypothetical protein
MTTTLSWVEHLDHDIPDEKCDYCLIYLDSLNDLVTREAGAA